MPLKFKNDRINPRQCKEYIQHAKASRLTSFV